MEVSIKMDQSCQSYAVHAETIVCFQASTQAISRFCW